MRTDKDAPKSWRGRAVEGSRTDGTNARALGTNPRALATNDRATARNKWALRNWKRKRSPVKGTR